MGLGLGPFIQCLTVALGFGIFLQSCCAPNACRYAKSGSAELEKSLAEIEKYKERNGKYPVTLDDIQKGFVATAELVRLYDGYPEVGLPRQLLIPMVAKGYP